MMPSGSSSGQGVLPGNNFPQPSNNRHNGEHSQSTRNMIDARSIPPQLRGSAAAATSGLLALGQAAAQLQSHHQSDHQDSSNPAAVVHAPHAQHPHQQQQSYFYDFLPVFSSLGLPMPQQLASRASSPSSFMPR